MKRYFFAIILCILLYSAAYCGVIYYDDPLSVGIGARAVGVGKAFVAIADDSNAILLNPAGLGSQRSWNISSMSTNFMEEYQYTMLSLVYPTPNGVYGLGYVSSSIGEINLSAGGTANFYNQALILSYGQSIGEALAPYIGHNYYLYGGLNLKYYSKGFSGDLKAVGSGYNMDAGLKWAYNQFWSFGINFQNFFQGSKIAGDFEPEDMPFVTKLGAAYYLNDYNLKFSLDKDMFFGRSVPWPMHFGLEWKAHQLLTLRVGLDQVAGASGGGDIATNPTFGVGFEYDGLRIDLAYMQNFAETNIASSFLSISFYGGPLFAEKKTTEEVATPAPPPTPAQKEAPVIPAVPEKPVTDKITIVNPQEKTYYTFDSEMSLFGWVEHDIVQIRINGKQIPINAEGVFSQTIPLNYDQNTFDVVVMDTEGHEGIIPLHVARYYKPKDVTTQEAKGEYIDKVIVQSKVREYLGRDYSANDYVSKEALETILSRIKEMRMKKAK